jgi:hypothetical protein
MIDNSSITDQVHELQVLISKLKSGSSWSITSKRNYSKTSS